MHDFGKKNRRKKRPSIDGMLSGSTAPGGQRKQPSSNKGHHHGVRSPGRRLDDFSGADGFHSIKRPGMRQAQATAATTAQKAASMSAGAPAKQPTRPVRTSETIDLSLEDGPKKPKPSLWRRFRRLPRKAKVAMAMVPVVLIGGFFIYTYMHLNNVFRGGGGAVALQDGVDPSQLKGEGDGRVNILLLGKGGEGHQAPDLTDTILIASIDPINNTASLLSIPRDFWVSPDGGGYTKINAVYANAKSYALYQGKNHDEAESAGIAAIETLVADITGIPMHYHAMVDFQAFEQAINTVGGVEIDVPEDNTVYEVLYDTRRGEQYVLNVQAGPQKFDGRRALFYARSRQTSQRGDFDRTERQRLLILALKEKILSLGTFSNPAKVSGLISSFGNNVRTNMSLNEMMRLYEIGKDINASDIASLGLADPPNVLVQTDMIDGLSVVRPVAGIGEYDDLRSYVRNSLRDGFLASEDAKVYILNGTTIAGLAGDKSEELKSFGYNVTGVGTAPTQAYAKTTLVDLSGGQNKFTKSYLETRLGVNAESSLPDKTIDPKGADFVIILGQDETSNIQN